MRLFHDWQAVRVALHAPDLLPSEIGSAFLRAFEIAHGQNQRIYDCFYVALAEREGAELWTGDERLCNAIRIRYPFVRFIADYGRQP